jgi:hypothetical protein
MLTLKCKKHPKYLGVQTPRITCSACAYLYHVRKYIESGKAWRLEVIG